MIHFAIFYYLPNLERSKALEKINYIIITEIVLNW